MKCGNVVKRMIRSSLKQGFHPTQGKQVTQRTQRNDCNKHK